MRTGMIRCLLVALALGASGNALAMLGGGFDTIAADQAKLGAAHQAVPVGPLTQHTLSAPGGGVVREYTTSAGLVVGVSWSGAGAPNFKQIFGDAYFSRFTAAQSQKQAISHRRFTVQDPDLVIESTGSMHRLYSGRAYLPQALPSGVSPDQIQ
jgi:hypothetical protein